MTTKYLKEPTPKQETFLREFHRTGNLWRSVNAAKVSDYGNNHLEFVGRMLENGMLTVSLTPEAESWVEMH